MKVPELFFYQETRFCLRINGSDPEGKLNCEAERTGPWQHHLTPCIKRKPEASRSPVPFSYGDQGVYSQHRLFRVGCSFYFLFNFNLLVLVTGTPNNLDFMYSFLYVLIRSENTHRAAVFSERGAGLCRENEGGGWRKQSRETKQWLLCFF